MQKEAIVVPSQVLSPPMVRYRLEAARPLVSLAQAADENEVKKQADNDCTDGTPDELLGQGLFSMENRTRLGQTRLRAAAQAAYVFLQDKRTARL